MASPVSSGLCADRPFANCMAGKLHKICARRRSACATWCIRQSPRSSDRSTKTNSPPPNTSWIGPDSTRKRSHNPTPPSPSPCYSIMPIRTPKPPSVSRRIEFLRPRLYPRQFEAIYAPQRYSVIEASTKSGKTVGCMVWLTEQAWLGKPGYEFWWVAPIYEQSRIVFRRLSRGLTRGTFVANQAESSITLANGAVLRFKGADNPDSLYGEDVHAAVIDEATRVKEDAWHAVRTTLTATRGTVRIIGNVKGRRNWAYRLARRAEAGEQDMHYARITAYDAIQAGVLAQQEIDDARSQLPEHVFRELYEAEPSDDEGNPFGITAIRDCLEPLHTE